MAPQTSQAPFRLAVASSLLLAIAALAQKPVAMPGAIQDPANLAGERVSAPDLTDTLPINHGAPALAQLLKKLRTRASLMMIVAHPDDEDGGMLTYESRGLGARVAMLTLTRGEGGQNLMTSDFNDALGLIRTQELLAADRYLGVDQFFGSVVDFGFSKTREETLEQWTHERVLYDTVRAVRLYRPLVLTSTWIGGVTDGHGHHQVSGQMNQEVFEAAADPKVFPEMGLPPWAPLKVYARMPFARIGKDGMFDYATGKSSPPRFYNYVTKQWTTTPPAANVMIPEGTTSNDPGMDGDTYLQFARKGLALQKTQIGGNVRPARAGNYDAPYTRYASRVEAKEKEQSFFDGIDTTLPGIADLSPGAPKLREVLTALDARFAEAQKLFTPEHPEATAPPLRRALTALDILIVAYSTAHDIPAYQAYNVLHELRIKRVQLNNAILLADGVSLTAALDPASQPLLTSEASAKVTVKLANAGDHQLLLLPTNLPGTALPPTLDPLLPGAVQVSHRQLALPAGRPATRPYFSRQRLEQPFYDIADAALRNAPSTPAPLIVSQALDDNGARLYVNATVSYAPSSIQPAAIEPPVSVTFSQPSGIIPLDAKEPMLWVESRAPKGKCLSYTNDVLPPSCNKFSNETTVHLKLPRGWTIPEGPTQAYTATDTTLTQWIGFTLKPPTLHRGDDLSGTASALWNGREYREGFRSVGYAGLTQTNYYTRALRRASAVDVKMAPGLRFVGYIDGTGDEVPAALLANLDIHALKLDAASLTVEKLKKFDVVLLGVRAYAAHPELANSTALLDYAKAGGVVIVQYNTARYGDDQSPYPITVPGDSAHNVVVEAQPVQILTPTSPVLIWPNTITSADFKGWTEELGHGFASSWDSHFEALTETHDPDQDPQQGGLLYARTGRGAYVYVAYALYRQLPEGVSGAYRLFANFLSLPKNPTSGIQQIAR